MLPTTNAALLIPPPHDSPALSPAARPWLRLLRAPFVENSLPTARVALGSPLNTEDDRSTLLAMATLRAAENMGDRVAATLDAVNRRLSSLKPDVVAAGAATA